MYSVCPHHYLQIFFSSSCPRCSYSLDPRHRLCRSKNNLYYKSYRMALLNRDTAVL